MPQKNVAGWMTQHCSRKSYAWERSSPYRNEKTGKPVGIFTYIVLTAMRLISDILIDLKKKKGGFKKLSHV